jgi:hypothetical protein
MRSRSYPNKIETYLRIFYTGGSISGPVAQSVKQKRSLPCTAVQKKLLHTVGKYGLDTDSDP